MKLTPKNLASVVLVIVSIAFAKELANAQTSAPHAASSDVCPRPEIASTIAEPADLRSENGVLRVDLALHNSKQPDGSVRYCYIDSAGHESPNLRVKPGDRVILHLKNALSPPDDKTTRLNHASMHKSRHVDTAMCAGEMMTSISTNLHFHGLTIPPHNTVFTIPPSSVRSIGDDLNDAKISWKYYGDQWNNYVNDPYQLNYGAIGPNTNEYCNICNPFQYDTSIMANPDERSKHIQDTTNLYEDIKNGTLPAVSIVKPSGLVDGHPASSKLNLFEGFTKKIIDEVKANPSLWADTAIFITFDEGGGYYDSGYVQPLDFFGDGTRIPLIVVSPYGTGGRITHNYSDHVSILKFIERNWRLEPVTSRSRDNFPNPKTEWFNPYVPVNSPAISDLFELFDFGHDHDFDRD